MSLGIETFAPPPKVDFDPQDSEHVLALALMQFHGRQHPTIRFKIDPKDHANAYVAMLDLYLKSVIPPHIMLQADEYAESRADLLVCRTFDGTDRIVVIGESE